MRKSFLKLFFIVGLAICPSTVKAVTFTTDKLIDAYDYSYDGNDIIVDGCVLTINGQHDFNSLSVINAGVVTHSPATTGQPNYRIDLTITDYVSISPDSSISADVKGYGPDEGLGAGTAGLGGGGGGYGGLGGTSYGAEGGGTYGSVAEPSELGSGGGSCLYGSDVAGGAGGGVIRLIVGGVLTNNGLITANGQNGRQYPGYIWGSGGGSGGSIFLVVGTLGGAGTISANGGNRGYNSYGGGGGGGGGRIAVHYNTDAFLGTISAAGGTGYSTTAAGGAGTIYTKSSSAPKGMLSINNGGNSGSLY